MAFLSITELNEVQYVGIQGNTGSNLQIAKVPPVAEQKLGVSGASVQSAAFNSATKYVRLYTDIACCVAWGTNPVAVTTSMPMSAASAEYFGVTVGHKVAVIANP